MNRRRLGTVVAGAALAAALTGCGGGRGAGPLAGAERAMAQLDAGRIEVEVTGTTTGDQPAGPVGFSVEGPFSDQGGGRFPVLDLRYSRLLGGTRQDSHVVSDGNAVYLVTDGRTVELTSDQASALRLGTHGTPVADLGIAGWMEGARVETRPDGTRVVTGQVDVADFLSDLARIGAGPGGDTDRLSAAVRSSEMTVELAKDDLPRSVRARVDFGPGLPKEIAAALGGSAAPRLELQVALERLDQPLKVAAPGP